MWWCWNDQKPKKVMIKDRSKVIDDRKENLTPSKAEKYLEYKRLKKDKYRWA